MSYYNSSLEPLNQKMTEAIKNFNNQKHTSILFHERFLFQTIGFSTPESSKPHKEFMVLNGKQILKYKNGEVCQIPISSPFEKGNHIYFKIQESEQNLEYISKINDMFEDFLLQYIIVEIKYRTLLESYLELQKQLELQTQNNDKYKKWVI